MWQWKAAKDKRSLAGPKIFGAAAARKYFYRMSLSANGTLLSTHIKEATAELHAETESLLSPRLSSIQTTDDYASLLKMFYGFYRPLELSIWQHIDANALADIADRGKTNLLELDLFALDQSIENISLCQSLPSINSTASAFGALYVVEGSTLGGRIITKMLLKNRAVPPDALRFFSGYGEATGSKWKSFLQALNQQSQTSEVTAGANATFLHLKSWMQR